MLPKFSLPTGQTLINAPVLQCSGQQACSPPPKAEATQGSFAELEEQWLPEDQHSPAQTRSGLAINGQDSSCCKFSLALSVPAATKAMCFALIKFLLASQPFLRGSGGPVPAESCKEYGKGYSREKPIQGGQNLPGEMVFPLPSLPNTPALYIDRKLNSWLFQQIPWVPKAILRPWGFQVASRVLPGRPQRAPL